jgi:hypothetical protein
LEASAVRLSRTNAARGLIEEFISSTKPDKFIESCLAQYLAVVFYAEMEERISEIIEAQLRKFTNTTIGRYLTSNMEQIIRRTPKSNIADLLSKFDAVMQKKFNAEVPDNEVTVYSNVITARHGVGHKQGSQISLVEIAKGITAAETILDKLDGCFQ